MDRLLQFEVFSKTAELGSLSKAAQTLRMSNAAVSRHLSALEERLAVRLIDRSTRRLRLTDAGQELLTRCNAALDDLAEAESVVGEWNGAPKGVLQVASSICFAVRYLAPMLPAFRRRYPEIIVDIIAVGCDCQVIDAGADVAILAREPAGIPNSVVQRIGSVQRVLSATPGYLAQHGAPRSPADLLDHHIVASDSPRVLRLSQGRVEEIVRVPSVVRSNEDQVIRAATLAGAGISDLPLYVVHDEIRRGCLVPLLADWHLPPSPMNIVYRDKRSIPARVRVFAEFLVESIQADAEAASLWTDLPRRQDDRAIVAA